MVGEGWGVEDGGMLGSTISAIAGPAIAEIVEPCWGADAQEYAAATEAQLGRWASDSANAIGRHRKCAPSVILRRPQARCAASIQ